MKKKIFLVVLTLCIAVITITKIVAATYVETAQFVEGEYLRPNIYI